MKNHVSTYLLDKYLNGNCTGQEEEQIKEWYDSFENEDDYISALSLMKKQELKNRIRSRVAEGINNHEYPLNNLHRTKWIRYTALTGIAASLLVFFCISYFSRQGNVNPQNTAQLVTLTNNTNSIVEQVLSDKSHVWLSPHARISYNKVFTGNSRDVYMTGESFFEVTKNPKRPFIIYSKNIITKVWGTSFRVRDSKDLSFADVAVVTGKVSVKISAPNAFFVKNKVVKDMASEVMIYPNQQVTFVKKENLFKLDDKKDIKELHIWKKINLSFDNSHMKDVVVALNRQFEVNIVVTDNTINDYLLSADFSGLNFPQIMEILKKTLNVSYDMGSGNIMLRKI